MGRRNASTFKKRQREVQKKEKKQAKLLQRKQRKDGGAPDVSVDAEPTHDPMEPRVRVAATPPAVIRLSDLTLPSSDSDD